MWCQNDSEVQSERRKEVFNVCLSFLLRQVKGAFVHTVMPSVIPQER